MTTIKSTNGQTDLWIGKEHAGGRFVRIEREDAGAADRFPAADILAALGVDELGCGCDEADQNLKKALARAAEAEAEALEQAKLVRTWADRAEKAETNLDTALDTAEQAQAKLAEAETKLNKPCGSCHPCDNWGAQTWKNAGERLPHVYEWQEMKARAENAEATLAKAEATIDRIKARVAASPSRYMKAELTKLLREPKPFELPTEAGAKFYATKNGYEELFETFTNGGESCLYGGECGIETPWSIMNNGWTGHRLIEAES